MKKIQKVLLIILLAGIFLPSIGFAQPLVPCSLTGIDKPRCTFCHLFELFDNITTFLFLKIIPVLAALMIAIGGVYFIFSQGSPEKLTAAKKLFTSVAIGLLIAYGAWLIVNTFFMIIGITSWGGFNGGWWQINCSTTQQPYSSSPPPSTLSSPSVPTPQPPSPQPPSPAQITICSLCSGNSMGQCDATECGNNNAPTGCNFVPILGRPTGMCVAPGDCEACGTVQGSQCDAAECGAIGGGCLFVTSPAPVVPQVSICVRPNDCAKCVLIPTGCTVNICNSIGNCNFVPGGLGLAPSCRSN